MVGNNKIAFFILLILVLTRFVNINQPLLEYNSSRQVQTAMIARNIAFNQAEVLKPEVDDQGRGPTYLMQEFPVITSLTAIIVRGSGSIPEWVLRSTSVIAFVIAAIFLFLFAGKIYGRDIANLSVLIFAVSPLSILMSRVYQPDMAMVASMLVCFYSMYKSLEKGSFLWGIIAALSFSLTVLFKITNLYLILPLGVFMVITPSKKGMGLWAGILCSLPAIIPILWWWGIYTRSVRMAFPNAYDTFGFGYLIQSMRAHLIYPPFYREIFSNLAASPLTPVLFVFSVFGLTRSIKRKDLFLVFWVFSVFLFFLMVPEQSKQEYYMLSFVPPGAILASLGLEQVFGKLRTKFARNVFVLVITMVTLLFTVRMTAPKFINRPEYQDVVDAGLRVQEISEKDDLVVASHGFSQDLLYYCNRRGWAFPVDRESLLKYVDDLKIDDNIKRIENVDDAVGELEARRNEGARFLVSVPASAVENMPVFGEYLMRNYDEIARDGDRYVIYDLGFLEQDK